MAKISMWWITELLQSVAFLSIKQGKGELFNSKKFYDISLPVIIGVLLTVLEWFAPSDRSLFATGGFFPRLVPVLGILAAFYIAALTAVAAIPSDWLDGDLRGRNVTLAGKSVNRRRYVLLLFSYLATTAFLMIVFLVLIELFHGAAVLTIPRGVLTGLRSLMFFVIVTWFSNLILTSLIGVIFLADRIHSPTQM